MDMDQDELADVKAKLATVQSSMLNAFDIAVDKRDDFLRLRELSPEQMLELRDSFLHSAELQVKYLAAQLEGLEDMISIVDRWQRGDEDDDDD